jgi:hypothetical protein
MCECARLKITPDHPDQACPVKAALFCSICQIHGHPTMKCPERHIWHYRKPEFVEQLLPMSVLEHYKITSLTPITSGVKEHIPYIHGDPVIEIPQDEDGKNIRATLSSHNLPSSSIKDNIRLIKDFGSLLGKEVVFTESAHKKKILKSKASKSSAVKPDMAHH